MILMDISSMRNAQAAAMASSAAAPSRTNGVQIQTNTNPHQSLSTFRSPLPWFEHSMG